MATKAQVQIWLTEAENALHALQIGEQIVQVSGEGRTTIYNQSDVGELKAYVLKLEGMLLTRPNNSPINLVRGLIR